MAGDVTNADIFLWALNRLGGANKFIDVEDVYVEAFKLAPLRFAWRTKKDLPDLKKCAKALRDAEAREPTPVAKSSDRYKQQLTVSGQQWVTENTQRLTEALESGADIPAPRQRPKESNTQRQERELARITASTAFQKASDGAASTITPREAESFFRLNDYIRGPARAAKIARVTHMFQDEPDVAPLIAVIREKVPELK